MTEKEKERLIKLTVKQTEATGEVEGVWFGLTKGEEKELEDLINKYKKP